MSVGDPNTINLSVHKFVTCQGYMFAQLNSAGPLDPDRQLWLDDGTGVRNSVTTPNVDAPNTGIADNFTSNMYAPRTWQIRACTWSPHSVSAFPICTPWYAVASLP